MKVTVVIPNYNGIKYLAACLDSLRCQTSKDFSILVVDNGSRDGSFELLSDYPEVKSIRFEENHGLCSCECRDPCSGQRLCDPLE